MQVAIIIKQIAHIANKEYSRDAVILVPKYLEETANKARICFEVLKDTIVFYTETSEHSKIARLQIQDIEFGDKTHPSPTQACIELLIEIKNET